MGRRRFLGRKKEDFNLYGKAIWSVRKVNPDYAGYCMRVRRSSDNAELDIGFIGEDLDILSIILFVGVGDGFVSVWYDQSGNAQNIIQTNYIYQPTIVIAGAVNTSPNGKPAIKFYINYLTGGDILAYDQSIYFSTRCYFQTSNACLLAKYNLGAANFKGGYHIRTIAGPAGLPRLFTLRNSNDVANRSELTYGSYDRSLMFEAKVGEIIQPDNSGAAQTLDGIGGELSNMDFTVGAMTNTAGVPSESVFRNTIWVQEINAFVDDLPSTPEVILMQENYFES